MTFYWPSSDVDFDATYDYSADINTDFYTEVDYFSYTNVDTYVDVCVDIDGNSAVFNVDVQASGDDGATEVNLVAFTTDYYSSITVTGYSAVD